MSGWYSVCTVGRCLREPADERAEQLLGLTAGADHLDNEQLLNSVSERLLLSTERNCWHALLQPDVVWHGDERCVPGLHRQPVRVAVAAGVAVACGVRRVHAPGEQPRLVPERPSPHHLPQRMRDRAPCDQLVVGLDAECRNNGFDNRSAGLLLLNDRHGPVQGNWTWHGKRHHAPDLHRQPVRVGVAIAAGVAWRLQYSVARIQQPRLMSGWYSVCTVGRCCENLRTSVPSSFWGSQPAPTTSTTSSSSTAYPSGCYYRQSGSVGQLYFNPMSSGMGTSDAYPVCIANPCASPSPQASPSPSPQASPSPSPGGYSGYCETQWAEYQ